MNLNYLILWFIETALGSWWNMWINFKETMHSNITTENVLFCAWILTYTFFSILILIYALKYQIKSNLKLAPVRIPSYVLLRRKEANKRWPKNLAGNNTLTWIVYIIVKIIVETVKLIHATVLYLFVCTDCCRTFYNIVQILFNCTKYICQFQFNGTKYICHIVP